MIECISSNRLLLSAFIVHLAKYKKLWATLNLKVIHYYFQKTSIMNKIN